jgi:hypothetical protein
MVTPVLTLWGVGRKRLISTWLNEHEDVVAAREGTRYWRGSGTGVRPKAFDVKDYPVPESLLDLLLVFDVARQAYMWQLHGNVEHELQVSAVEGETRSATLWRLGCTGVVHRLAEERAAVAYLTRSSLSGEEEQVRHR